MRTEAKTKSSEENKWERVKFRQEILGGVNDDAADLSTVFFANESLFLGGKRVSNKRNNCKRAPKGARKKGLRPDVTSEGSPSSNLHTMVAMEASEMGCASPICVSVGATRNRATYKV